MNLSLVERLGRLTDEDLANGNKLRRVRCFGLATAGPCVKDSQTSDLL